MAVLRRSLKSASKRRLVAANALPEIEMLEERKERILVQEDADMLKRYRDLGAVRVSVSLPAAKADATLPVLDRWAALIRQVNG